MKKTVKVLFSLVLVCLFAVQFAGAMPASASADRVDSKWDNVQLDTSVYVYGDDGAVKQDGDFGVKAADEELADLRTDCEVYEDTPT